MTTIVRAPRTGSPLRTASAFLAIFCLLYASLFWIAERRVRTDAPDTALQKLAAYDAASVDWLVLGASHALPLEFGGVPARLQAESGQTMLVLAEIAAGPVYSELVLDRALEKLQVENILYIVDGFAFASEDWNEARFSDRTLLARMPLDPETARLLAGRVLIGDAPVVALLDYLTGFSKLNPVDRFPTEGWQGAADFDKVHRPSRHAVAARVQYLYPDGAPDPELRNAYLARFARMLDWAERTGAQVLVVQPPVPPAFAAALPGQSEFEIALVEALSGVRVRYVDHKTAIPDPSLYFDTDHLNRAGVEAFYTGFLRKIL